MHSSRDSSGSFHLNRWVLKYAPELDKRIRPKLRSTNDSWRVDQTYIKVKGVWKYLYRAVDSKGNTLDFLLSAKRDGRAASVFFSQSVHRNCILNPRMQLRWSKMRRTRKLPLTLKGDETLSKTIEFRQNKYLNNVIEQDRRGIKQLTNADMGFRSFNITRRTLRG
jgi:transposase-like protein